nr:O-antigen ligase family protein [Pseudodesulfovibrio sp.]
MGLLAYLPLAAIVFVSLQAVFLQPYIILVVSERTNLFTPALTLGALLVVGGCFFVGGRSKDVRLCCSWEPWSWFVLGVLVLISGGLSSEQPSSLYRVFSFFAPALAGYWCGRIVFNDHWLQRYIEYLLTALFILISVIQLVSGYEVPFLGVHHHAMANVLLLLMAGPLSLFIRAHIWPRKVVLLFLLFLGFFACFVIGSRFIILLPFVLLPLIIGLKFINKRYGFLALLLAVLAATAFFVHQPSKILHMKNYESVFYRVEGVPASLHIVAKEPLFGIGLRASREPYLEDYELLFDLSSRELFMNVVRHNVTADNMLTTMLVGFGVVPTFMYLGMLGLYGRRLFYSLCLQQKRGLATPAIGLSLAACIVHFAVQDGLLFPQVNWFFHFFIGLVPLRNQLRG